MSDTGKSDVTALTVQLLTAYFANNTVAPESLADLVRATRSALQGAPDGCLVDASAPLNAPAVSIDESLASPAPNASEKRKAVAKATPPARTPDDGASPALAGESDVRTAPANHARGPKASPKQSPLKKGAGTKIAKRTATKAKNTQSIHDPAPAIEPGRPKTRPKLKLFGSRQEIDPAKRVEDASKASVPARSKYLRTP